MNRQPMKRIMNQAPKLQVACAPTHEQNFGRFQLENQTMK